MIWVKLASGLIAIALAPPLNSFLDADASEVVWQVGRCEEAVALVPTTSFGPGTVVTVLAYKCEEASVEGSPLPNGIAVGEISVMRPDGTSTLLRQVIDDIGLVKRLRALGLADTSFGSIEFATSGGPAPLALEVTVTRPETTYSMSGTSVQPGEPAPASGGASYTYDGRRGTVRVAYENHTQAITLANMSIDATRDSELRVWLGGQESARAPGAFAVGTWTGTATLESSD